MSSRKTPIRQRKSTRQQEKKEEEAPKIETKTPIKTRKRVSKAPTKIIVEPLEKEEEVVIKRKTRNSKQMDEDSMKTPKNSTNHKVDVDTEIKLEKNVGRSRRNLKTNKNSKKSESSEENEEETDQDEEKTINFEDADLEKTVVAETPKKSTDNDETLMENETDEEENEDNNKTVEISKENQSEELEEEGNKTIVEEEDKPEDEEKDENKIPLEESQPENKIQQEEEEYKTQMEEEENKDENKTQMEDEILMEEDHETQPEELEETKLDEMNKESEELEDVNKQIEIPQVISNESKNEEELIQEEEEEEEIVVKEKTKESILTDHEEEENESMEESSEKESMEEDTKQENESMELDEDLNESKEIQDQSRELNQETNSETLIETQQSLASRKIVNFLRECREKKLMIENIQSQNLHESCSIILSQFRDFQFLKIIHHVIRQNKAAKTIQSAMRSFSAKKEIQRRRKEMESIKAMQSILRQQILITFKWRQNECCTIIQSACRSYLVSKETLKLKKEERIRLENKTATKIQSICRMFLVKRRTKVCLEAIREQKKIEKLIEEKKMNNRAASIIQSRARTYLIRKEYKKMKKSAILLQCWIRKKQAEKELQKRKYELENEWKERENKLSTFQEYWRSAKDFGYKLLFGESHEKSETKKKFEKAKKKFQNRKMSEFSDLSSVVEGVNKRKRDLELLEKENEMREEMRKKKFKPSLPLFTKHEFSFNNEPAPVLTPFEKRQRNVVKILEKEKGPINPFFQHLKEVKQRRDVSFQNSLEISIDEFEMPDFPEMVGGKRKNISRSEEEENSKKKIKMETSFDFSTKPPRYPSTKDAVVVVKPTPVRMTKGKKRENSLLDDTVIE
jgi:hypothetical protein